VTLYARQTLEDCKIALNEVKEGVTGSQWRIRWVAAVALLRTVGHVLEYVDASQDSVLKKIIEDAWNILKSTKPQPEIFWEFIVKERNNILKEYQFGAGIGTNINMPIIDLDSDESPQVKITHNYLITKGPYRGKDQREVLKEAIEWWESYLTKIENEYAK